MIVLSLVYSPSMCGICRAMYCFSIWPTSHRVQSMAHAMCVMWTLSIWHILVKLSCNHTSTCVATHDLSNAWYWLNCDPQDH
jgi:hypothetical protein